MKELETIEQYHELKDNKDTIFLFSADWCGDCRYLDPDLPKIENAYPEYTFIKVDRDKFIDLCIENDILGIPSFLAFKNAKEVGRFVSKDRKTKEEVIQFIKDLPA
ncbi:thioredoxin [Oceanobacillus piezotolerans]|uniref:Thioredoxin n=1 Tax=Oceanobacillus piezotolerans TaxID=2448030 RepID=A0A498DCM3_9BACI|nr:thioredoxin family protein [Oceanobacillus piezotolerans]RLL47796.1 thioredoxin [Oceanobacillus piezotolerans]